jgi:hypothetical protein
LFRYVFSILSTEEPYLFKSHYKEVIVEEAIARLLEQAQSNPEELIAVLRQRKEKRK